MDEERNVQIVREAYAAFKRGDIPGVLNALTEDVDWWVSGPAAIPWVGHRRGREQVDGYFKVAAQAAEFNSFEAREFIAQGNKVVALGLETGLVRATERTFEIQWVMVFTFRDGKIARFREYIVANGPSVAAFIAMPT